MQGNPQKQAGSIIVATCQLQTCLQQSCSNLLTRSCYNLLTTGLLRFVTATCNRPANNARITRHSSTLLQFVNCRLVAACWQQDCSNLLATRYYRLARGLLTTVFLRLVTTTCNKPANNTLQTCHYKPEEHVWTHPYIGLSTTSWNKAVWMTCYNLCDFGRVESLLTSKILARSDKSIVIAIIFLQLISAFLKVLIKF